MDEKRPLSNLLREHWDQALVGVFCLGLVIAAQRWSPLAGYHPPTSGDRVQLECLSGNCWLRPMGSMKLQPIAPGYSVEALVGDEAVSLGKGSSLVVHFEGEGGELQLANTGIIRIARGHRDVAIQDVGQASPSPSRPTPAAATPSSSSLVYIGELPISIVSPVMGTPIVATSFPVKVHLAFNVERMQDVDLAKLSTWSLVDVHDEAHLTRLANMQVGHQLTPQGGAVFFADFIIPKPGVYAFVPTSMDLVSSNINFSFRVQGVAGLENQLKDLLKNVNSGGDDQIEIRGQ